MTATRIGSILTLIAGLFLLAACANGETQADAGTTYVFGIPIGRTSPATPSPSATTIQVPPTASATARATETAVAVSTVAATGEDSDDIPSEAPVLTPTAVPSPAPSPTPASTRNGKRVVALDPGHGGPEIGAAAYGLLEKDVNLDIALRLEALLKEEGYEIVLTRDTDRATSPLYTGGGYAGGLTHDVQARVDIANAAGADAFISIHNNGSGDPDQSGTEVWYNKDRTFSDRNLALAELVQENLLANIRALGYRAVDRGIKDDSNFRVFRGRTYNLYVLGPGTGPRPHVPTQMPGVLGESLFLSHAGDASMLAKDSTLDAIAAGYRDALVAYFAAFPD